MTTDEDAFLRAITERPDDDTPRLVYADWLDERGDEDASARAELIRAQCEQARLAAEGRRSRGLERRVSRVLAEYSEPWTAPLRATKLGREWRFRRGFVEEVTISATEFAARAEQLFRLAPMLRSARFPDASNEVTGLARCPYLARLTAVDLTHMCRCGGCPIDRELAVLFASKNAANLTVLKLAGDRIDADGAGRLAASKHLAGLTELDLADNPLGPDGVRELAASPHLDRLVKLDLSRAGFGSDGPKALAAAPHLAGLRMLLLRGNEIGPLGTRLLAASPLLGRLTALDLSGNRLGDGGARALAESPQAAGLVSLNVTNNGIGPEAAERLRARFGKRVRV